MRPTPSTPPSRWRGHPRALHSFPTRRSSDLAASREPKPTSKTMTAEQRGMTAERYVPQRGPAQVPAGGRIFRSEEHTSELQSRGDLVCRLLLEKKKN